MEVKMKVALLCCVLFLAGCASAGPAEAKIDLPDWIPDIPDKIQEILANLPDSILELIDSLPEILDDIPDIIDRIRERLAEIIEKVPETVEAIIDKLPDIVAQAPAVVDVLRDLINDIADRAPEYIASILDQLPAIIEAVPCAVDVARDIYNTILEYLEANDIVPDWLPGFPDSAPAWWPPQVPQMPEINKPTPGVITTVNEHPSIVAIEVGFDPIWIQGCVGSILTTFHIVTAARCSSGPLFETRFRRVRAGSSVRNTGGTLFDVDSAINHPDFTSPTVDGDISLWRLKTNVVFGSNIQATSIIPQDFALPSGSSVQLVSWGSTAEGKLAADRNLYQINLSTVDQTTCTARWSRFPSIDVAGKLCVGDPTTGGRNGDIRDIGAPISVQNILVAIESYAAIFGNSEMPVIATYIGDYSDWIISNAV